MTDTPQPEKTPAPSLEVSVRRAADAIAAVIMRGGDHVEAAHAALKAGQPSDAMTVRAARLLLTEKGILPEVHVGIGNPLRPLCGNPDGFDPGGRTTMTLEITCSGCLAALGDTEDQLAEWERWSREGIPADQRAMSSAEAKAIVEAKKEAGR